jgi:hypothetical protein
MSAAAAGPRRIQRERAALKAAKLAARARAEAAGLPAEQQTAAAAAAAADVTVEVKK